MQSTLLPTAGPICVAPLRLQSISCQSPALQLRAICWEPSAGSCHLGSFTQPVVAVLQPKQNYRVFNAIMRSDNVKTAEGLGGTNIQGADDPKTRIDAAHSNVAEPKPSDPEWVNRKNPEDIPRYSEAGKGVGYDQASEALVMLPGHQTGTTGMGERAGITAASVSNVTPQEHAIGGRGDPEHFGAVGADYSGGRVGKQRDRASAGDDTLINKESAGRSNVERRKAGTEEGATE